MCVGECLISYLCVCEEGVLLSSGPLFFFFFLDHSFVIAFTSFLPTVACSIYSLLYDYRSNFSLVSTFSFFFLISSLVGRFLPSLKESLNIVTESSEEVGGYTRISSCPSVSESRMYRPPVVQHP